MGKMFQNLLHYMLHKKSEQLKIVSATPPWVIRFCLAVGVSLQSLQNPINQKNS
jgi:hypothetical protein